MLSLNLLAYTALVISATAYAQTTCNATTPCPASAPCCSEYGFCGSDNFCLGGCNPLASHSLDSCRPQPLCQDMTHTFADNSRIILNNTYYDGNASAHDWVLEQGEISNTSDNGGELVLTLTETNGGTKLSSTRYVHYGTITATLKAGRWDGVVAAFITMSDIKDEIDWEFPGNNVKEGQSNFFWQGYIPTPTDGATHDVSSDNFANYHDYTIDWQPDALTFKIDNKTVRTVNKSDMEKDGISRYPNTPSRIQLSLWPAGINTTAQGTIDWAGGMIKWDDPDYVSAGHFYMRVNKVTVQCSKSDKVPTNSTSYIYAANTTTDTPGVGFSNSSTLLNAGVSLRGLGAAGIKSVFGLVGLMIAISFL